MAISSISASFPAAATAKPAASPSLTRAERSSESAEATFSLRAAVSAADTTRISDAAVEQAQPSRQQIDQAMEKMREALPPVARNLQFSVDEETGRSVVRVVDASTNEVIRQMPSEELLTIAKALDQITGLLLKQKA